MVKLVPKITQIPDKLLDDFKYPNIQDNYELKDVFETNPLYDNNDIPEKMEEDIPKKNNVEDIEVHTLRKVKDDASIFPNETGDESQSSECKERIITFWDYLTKLSIFD